MRLNYTRDFISYLFLVMVLISSVPYNSWSQSNDLSLQGIIDFTTPSFGNTGKAIHVRAIQNIPDLSIYGIGVANNGGGTDGQEYTFDPISVLAGEDILVARDISVMSSYFDVCFSEFEHVLQATSQISQNGDDAIELFENGVVIETFGDINVDGTGECWEYLDSWAYKASGDPLCLGGNWIFGGVNCTDGTTTIYDAPCLYPICNNLPCSLSVNNITHVSCYGGYDGSLSVSGSGGTGEFFYSIQYYNPTFNMYFELAHSPDTGQYISYPAIFINIPSNCYLITLEDSLGCMDSTTVCITQPDSIYSITNLTVCNQTVWNWNYYDTSGVYNSVLTASNGCDSSAILNLTVNYSDTSYTNITACDSATWNGMTYYTSGTYNSVFTNSSGCDSVAILNLIINNSSSNLFSVTSCDSYVWDGVTYLFTGLYTTIYSDVNGCDSTVILDLTINTCSGCTDSLANNYNPFAIVDDSTCLYSPFVFGCTDSLAENYNPLATIDDSSCCYNTGQLWSQIGQDIDGESADDFSGYSVSFNSDASIVAIGAVWNDGNGSDAGQVRIYENIGGSWSQVGQDIDGEASGDNSGKSVSLSSDGSIVAIGATYNDGNSIRAGHVRIYENIGGSWYQLGQDIDGEAMDDESGVSVSLSNDGSIVAIGAVWNDGNGSDAGQVRIYENISGIWVQIGQNIDGEAAGDGSGRWLSLSNDGSIVAIGAPYNDGNGSDAGHVRIYENLGGTWSQIGQDIDGEAADDKSGSVSLSSDGSIVAIGAYENDGNGYNSGHVRIYENISGTWIQIGQDLDGEAYGRSGLSVSISSDGNTVAIGAPFDYGGNVCIYENFGGSWSQIGQDIDGESYGDQSGHSVSLSSDGNTVVIGATHNNGNGNESGHVRVYGISTPCSDLGCLDPLALNFDPYATVDDSSCVYPNYGCIDTLAINYDPLANISDSSCTYCYNVVVFDTTVVCNGDSVLIGSSIYTSSGDYIDSLLTLTGCDSVVYSHIILNDINILQNDTSICDGDSILLNVSGYCDPSSLALGSLLYSATQTFGGAWNIDWPVNIGYDYILKVSGTYGIAGGSALDAAYSLTSQTPYNAACSGYLDKWRLIDGCPARPNPDLYNSSHEYFYFINNSDGIVNIDFSDCCYGDNSGSLTFELYENNDTCLDNSLLWSSGDTTSSIIVSPNQTTTYIVSQIINGHICSDSVTITVSSSDTSYTNITACDSVLWNGDYYDSSGTYYYSGGISSNTNSLYYAGGGDYIQISDTAVNDLNSGTYMAWVDLDDNTSETILVKQSDGENTYSHLAIGYYCDQTGHGASGDAGRIYFHSQNSMPAASSSGFVSINNWCHIAITFSQDSVSFYINGGLYGTTMGDYSIPDDLTVTSTRFGHFDTFNLHGNLDEFSIWNRMLTQQEIQQYMDCSPVGSESNLVASWNFNEGSGSITSDQSSNGFDGSLGGATWSTNVPSQSCQSLNSNGCDSVSVLNLTINNSSSSTVTVTACDFYVWDGVTYDSTGIYTNLYTGSNTCDSTVTLDLTINNRSSSTVTITACDSFDWDGVTYNLTGMYTNVYAGSNGCDSTVTLDLTINNSSSSTVIATACDSFDWDGVTYNSTGMYTNIYTDVNGCDSTVTLDLTINNSSSSTVIATACDSFDWDGVTYDSTGMYTNVYVDVNGCDSTVTLDLTINNSSSSTVIATACDSFDWDGVTYDSTGMYTNIYADVNGCDSTVTLDLTINNSSSSTVIATACDSFDWDGVTYDSTGMYTNVYVDVNGCDSTVTLDLIINSSYLYSDTVVACDSYVFAYFNGLTYDSTGVYSDTLTSFTGCDSVITLVLTINYSSYTNDTVITCDSYLWNGQTFYISGVYDSLFTNSVGCDSLATLNLTILYNSSSLDTVSACDSYFWNGNTYYTSGYYDSLFTNFAGCDSLAMLFLTINNSDTSYAADITACDSAIWNGTTYYTSGTYSSIFTNSSGCDSVSILNLTINQSDTTYISITACDSITWNGITYYTSGNYTSLFANFSGCDSLSVLDLTIYNSSSNLFSVVSCDSYVWDGVTYDSTGIYTNVYTNVSGCDSLATLDLYISSTTSIIDTQGICYGDSISIGNNTYYNSGTFIDTLQSLYGCDSLIISTFISYLPVGCIDSSALNYDSLAQCDDGSCIYPIYGCLDSSAINYYSGANFDDGSCIYAGCTDSTANNYNPNATIDDGSCIYTFCSNPSPYGFFTNNITDTKAKINWNNMNDSACMVWKYFVRYREVGTNTWTTKSAGVGSGLCNVGLSTISKVLQNLSPSTTYEYKMKAFYCGGTESSYSSLVQFTTKDLCPDMINLSTQTFYFNPNKVRFNWDTTGLYTFARIVLRVDSIGSSWQGVGGYGIYYPSISVNKYGMQPGQFYRAQGRTFCDSSITSYRSWWTPPIFWQQPSQIRMNGGTSITHLDVYPNPSRDVFNISFVSEIKQSVRLRILNMLGEEIYVEEKEEYIGEYTKQMNLDKFRKGIYFLEIETGSGVVNKKLILQ